MNLLVGIAIFVTLVLFIEGSFFTIRVIRNPERKQLRRRLQRFTSEENDGQSIDIVRKRLLSEVPWLNVVLSNTPGMPYVRQLLEQADCRYSVGIFLSLSVLLTLTGLLVGSLVLNNIVLRVGGAALCGLI